MVLVPLERKIPTNTPRPTAIETIRPVNTSVAQNTKLERRPCLNFPHTAIAPVEAPTSPRAVIDGVSPHDDGRALLDDLGIGVLGVRRMALRDVLAVPRGPRPGAASQTLTVIPTRRDATVDGIAAAHAPPEAVGAALERRDAAVRAQDDVDDALAGGRAAADGGVGAGAQDRALGDPDVDGLQAAFV